MNMKKFTALALLHLPLIGCTSTPVLHDTYNVEQGSLRLQTQVFSAKYNIDVIAYHHSIATSDDYIVSAPKSLIDPQLDRQSALQDMYDGSPYIPVLKGNVLTVYPLTTKYSPLAGEPRTNFKVVTNKLTKPSQVETTKTSLARENRKPTDSEQLKVAAVEAKANVAPPTKLESHKQNDASMSKKAEVSEIGNQSKPSALVKSSETSNSKRSVGEKVDKTYTHVMAAGQSYRDVLPSWASKYGIDSVVYATSPKLRHKLVQPAPTRIEYKASSETDLFNKMAAEFSSDAEGLRFKVRIVPHEGKKVAVIHQFATHDVSLFEVKQGSLKENAYRLARKFGYKTTEESNPEFTSWNLDVDPQIHANTVKAIPNNVRIAYGVLFAKHNVKALLLDSNKTVFFQPRANYKVSKDDV
ncbi:hypothetical protein L1D14_10775 [Vibrio tubiashii]|uniref:hypothetical protein n=1 Tax=Vibrio tubiashii TaxID=29498 RepID=UPI001EFDEACC|nr:hypothetical protein [Vibrio tubiashii]MCG9576722.1 hypothetical protein [Vibrio tubiashii]